VVAKSNILTLVRNRILVIQPVATHFRDGYTIPQALCASDIKSILEVRTHVLLSGIILEQEQGAVFIFVHRFYEYQAHDADLILVTSLQSMGYLHGP
jgi:hypothetical protein